MNEQSYQPNPTAHALANVDLLIGSHDGHGAGDHDEPFHGFRHYQFSTRQLARLLLLRGQVLDAKLGRSQSAAERSQ